MEEQLISLGIYIVHAQGAFMLRIKRAVNSLRQQKNANFRTTLLPFTHLGGKRQNYSQIVTPIFYFPVFCKTNGTFCN
ncbi:hypothetical protein DWQ65_07675 [Treponema phagedenis]|nr:hypothetical protein HMPREF9554_01960 [Treponema phagedenis F0421]QSH93765.1 hypothetical protein C5O78_01620 [Treponema phagedenis]QSH99946.1 hypothetical protein DWQ65_07675 [Treponema phagedenis]